MTSTMILPYRMKYWNERYRQEGKIWGEKPCWIAEDTVRLFKSHGIRSILVPGCAYGRHVIYLAKAGFEVVGVDFSKKAIQIAKFSSNSNLSVKYKLADVCKIPFPDRSFDGIFAYNIFHLLLSDERLSFMKELRRITARRGIIVIVAMSDRDGTFGKGIEVEENTFDMDCQGKPTHFFSQEELLSHLGEYKIKTIDEIEISECHSGRTHTHLAIRVIIQ